MPKSDEQKERDQTISDWKMLAEAIIGCDKAKDNPDRAWDCNNCEEFPQCHQYHSHITHCVCMFIANLIDGTKNSLSGDLANMIKDISSGEKEKKDLTSIYS